MNDSQDPQSNQPSEYPPHANFGPDSPALDSSSFEISDAERYTLAGIFFAVSLMGAVFTSIFVDPLSIFTSQGEKEANNKKNVFY